MNGYGDYYTTKGQGSQEAYDAYYADYGNAGVWAHLNAVVQSNVVNRGNPDAFVTTHDAILETGIDKLQQSNKNAPVLLLLAGFLAYRLL